MTASGCLQVILLLVLLALSGVASLLCYESWWPTQVLGVLNFAWVVRSMWVPYISSNIALLPLAAALVQAVDAWIVVKNQCQSGACDATLVVSSNVSIFFWIVVSLAAFLLHCVWQHCVDNADYHAIRWVRGDGAANYTGRYDAAVPAANGYRQWLNAGRNGNEGMVQLASANKSRAIENEMIFQYYKAIQRQQESEKRKQQELERENEQERDQLTKSLFSGSFSQQRNDGFIFQGVQSPPRQARGWMDLLAGKRPALFSNFNNPSSEPSLKRARYYSNGTDTMHVKSEETNGVPSLHVVNCPICMQPLSIASHLTLPYWKPLQAPTYRKLIRNHCKEIPGHDMLWEVATREDFISDGEFACFPDEVGAPLLLLHTFLKEAIFPDIPTSASGRDRVLQVLTCWKVSLKTKGMVTLRAILRPLERHFYVPLAGNMETECKQGWVAQAIKVIACIHDQVLSDRRNDVPLLAEWCKKATEQLPAEYQKPFEALLLQRLQAIVDHKP